VTVGAVLAVGTLVFAAEHVMLLAAILGMALAVTVTAAWVLRRSARLAVVYWPSMQRQAQRPTVATSRPQALPAPQLALPAVRPVISGCDDQRGAASILPPVARCRGVRISSRAPCASHINGGIAAGQSVRQDYTAFQGSLATLAVNCGVEVPGSWLS
jgi:hypothetical protein